MPSRQPSPPRPSREAALSPAAFAHLSAPAQVAMLTAYLHDLDEQLQWVDAALAGHGLCAREIILSKAAA